MTDSTKGEDGGAEKVPKPGRQGFPLETDLPDPIAYDSAFRTLLNKCPKLILPVLNELFHEHYSGQEEVVLLHSSNRISQPGQRDLKRYPDSIFSAEDPKSQLAFSPFFTVGDELELREGVAQPDAPSGAQQGKAWADGSDGYAKKHYHIECESSAGGASEVVRIFEYGFISAMDGKTVRENRLKVSFPHSAVLYLRSDVHTPDWLEIEIETPGGSVSYSVPVLKISDYGIDELFDKNLLFLVPFYSFNCEGDMKAGEEDSEILGGLLGLFQGICHRIDVLLREGRIDSYVRDLLEETTFRVASKLAEKYKKTQKGIGEIMGGYVVDILPDKYIRQGFELGRNEGLELGRSEGLELGRNEGLELGFSQGKNQTIFKFVQDGYISLELAAQEAGMTPEELKTAMQEAGYRLP